MNVISGRESSDREKLKTRDQMDRLWTKSFLKNFLCKKPFFDKQTTRRIFEKSNENKEGNFSKKELNIVFCEKTVGLHNIPVEVLRSRLFNKELLQ